MYVYLIKKGRDPTQTYLLFGSFDVQSFQQDHDVFQVNFAVIIAISQLPGLVQMNSIISQDSFFFFTTNNNEWQS